MKKEITLKQTPLHLTRKLFDPVKKRALKSDSQQGSFNVREGQYAARRVWLRGHVAGTCDALFDKPLARRSGWQTCLHTKPFSLQVPPNISGEWAEQFAHTLWNIFCEFAPESEKICASAVAPWRLPPSDTHVRALIDESERGAFGASWIHGHVRVMAFKRGLFSSVVFSLVSSNTQPLACQVGRLTSYYDYDYDYYYCYYYYYYYYEIFTTQPEAVIKIHPWTKAVSVAK